MGPTRGPTTSSLQRHSDQGEGDGQGAEGRSSSPFPGPRLSRDAGRPVSLGLIAFQETASGLVNTDWSSNPPPSTFPILCAVPTLCNNGLASTYYQLIWGTRAPVLTDASPEGNEWSTTGGAQGDVSELVGLPRLREGHGACVPEPVKAAKVRTEITQAGALGDPYGSGVRTVWWVYGVGPVKTVFEHSGSGSPITTSVLTSTNSGAVAASARHALVPARQGRHGDLPVDELEAHEEAVGAAADDRRASQRVGAHRGQARVRADPGRRSLGFTTRADGITNLWATTKSATISPLPALGPSAAQEPEAQLRDAVRPDDLRLQPAHAGRTLAGRAGRRSARAATSPSSASPERRP